MTTTLTIARRYRGPLTSGNGGYSAGLLAAHVDAATAEVTLRLPPPLETPLEIRTTGHGTVMLAGDDVVAEAVPAALDLDVPPPVSWEEAAAAEERHVAIGNAVFSECFVCGVRAENDHLAIHAGAVAGREPLYAARWVASEVSGPVVWAAIDCPGAFATSAFGRGYAVLGRMTARVDRLPREGERCVVLAWPIERDGRKHTAGTALLGEDGAVLARARQIWIEPREA